MTYLDEWLDECADHAVHALLLARSGWFARSLERWSRAQRLLQAAIENSVHSDRDAWDASQLTADVLAVVQVEIGQIMQRACEAIGPSRLTWHCIGNA